MHSKYKELLSNTAVFAISNLLSKVLLMLLLPVYTHKLTTAEYGVVELATNVSLLIIPFVSLAIQDAVFRFTVDKSINEKLVFKNSFWVLCFGTIMLFGASALLYFYEPLRQWKFWFWCFASLNMIRTSLSLYAKGTDRTKIFAIDGVLYNFVLAVSNILLLVVIELRVEGYFLALIIAQLFSIVFLLFNVEKPSFQEIFSFPLDKDSLRKMLQYSAPLILNSISWNLAHSVDRIMLERIRTTGDVGIYSAASKVPSLISTVMNIFVQAWTISAIRNFESEDGRKFYSQVFCYVQMILMIATLGVLLINNRILVYLFGGDFRQAVSYTPILMVAASILFYSNYFGPIFSSVQKSKTLMTTTLAGTVVNIVLNMILIRLWGIYGACVATLVSNTVVSISRIFLSRKIYSFTIDWKTFLIGWVFLFIACVATLFGAIYAEAIDGLIIVFVLIMYKSHLKDAFELMKHSLKGKIA